MFGLILTVTLAAALPTGETTCDQVVAPRCDMDAQELARLNPVARDFATPAMIDCRLPAVAPGLQAMVGECDGTTRDTSYRASRDPESERSSGSLHPARRERSRAGTLSALAGLPSEGGDATVSGSSSQPLALFAVPDLPRQSASRFLDDATLLPRSRQLRPLERPPRA